MHAAALDLDIRDAATTHLLATGTLGDTHTIHRSNATTPKSVTFPEPHSASGLRPSPASRGSPHLSPLPSDKEMCTPWSMAPDAPRDISRGPGPDFKEPNPAGGDSFVLQPPVSDPAMVDGQIQLPTSQDVNDHAFANPLYRTFGAMSNGGRSGSTAADPSALSSIRSGGQAGVPPGESGGFLSAASSYLKTPYHSYMSAQVDATASHPPMSTGNPLQPFSVSELPGEEHHPESGAVINTGDSLMHTGGPYGSITPHSARSHYDGADSLISIPHTAGHSARSRGMPTVSHAFEPGPYHQANAQLRRQLPHYHAHMSTVIHWDQVFVRPPSPLSCLKAVFPPPVFVGRIKLVQRPCMRPPYSSVAARLERGCLCWHTFACLPGPPSMRGCPACGPGPILPRRACLRLILFCTCLSLCAGVLWPMPAWVWRDVLSVFFCVFACGPCRHGVGTCHRVPFCALSYGSG